MSEKDRQVERYIKGMRKQERKQKLRDYGRKTASREKGKKPRQKDIIARSWDDWEEFDDYPDLDPFQPDTERSRRKFGEQQTTPMHSDDGRSSKPASGLSGALENDDRGYLGLVLEAGSSMCRIEHEGETWLCDLRGNLKHTETGFVNTVAAGDQVIFRPSHAGRGIVEKVLPRRNFLARPYSPDQGVVSELKQIIVANVDQLLIVASWREPNVWPAIIDRYLIAALRNHIEPVICINKVDLVDDRSAFDEFLGAYSRLGYKLIQTSVVSRDGIDDLMKLLVGSTSVFAGLSGVGKSSLLMAVQPGLDLKIGHVSEHGLYTGQGRHTTTQSRLLKLDCGGVVTDTPGVRSFGLDGISPGELAEWYPEMTGHHSDCRFGDCYHIDEPDCSVKQAVAAGEISALRYKNYTQIFAELAEREAGLKP